LPFTPLVVVTTALLVEVPLSFLLRPGSGMDATQFHLLLLLSALALGFSWFNLEIDGNLCRKQK
jgi:hypothetical protein